MGRAWFEANIDPIRLNLGSAPKGAEHVINSAQGYGAFSHPHRHKMYTYVWRSILLIYFFLLATEAISSSEQCARYPKQINVDQLYNRSDRLNRDKLPFINNRDYLTSLAKHASLCEIMSAIIVVGAKSSGKSKGFQQIIPMWKESGHTVININLKGNVSSQRVVKYVAREITNVFLPS